MVAWQHYKWTCRLVLYPAVLSRQLLSIYTDVIEIPQAGSVANESSCCPPKEHKSNIWSRSAASGGTVDTTAGAVTRPASGPSPHTGWLPLLP